MTCQRQRLRPRGSDVHPVRRPDRARPRVPPRRPSGRLATLQFRFGWVMVAGLLVQVVLFSTAVSDMVGELGPPIYIVSTAVVIASVLANLRITGMALVALGAISNLVAICSTAATCRPTPGRWRPLASRPDHLLEQRDRRGPGPSAPHRHLRPADLGSRSRTCSASATSSSPSAWSLSSSPRCGDRSRSSCRPDASGAGRQPAPVTG